MGTRSTNRVLLSSRTESRAGFQSGITKRVPRSPTRSKKRPSGKKTRFTVVVRGSMRRTRIW
jgi:hypothetical protein